MYESPNPRVNATESPKSSTRTGGAADTDPGSVVVVVVVPVRADAARERRAGHARWSPVVAATTATSTAPTPTGTATQAFHCRTKVPIRIGRSTRWKDTTETAKVTRTRTAKSS